MSAHSQITTVTQSKTQSPYIKLNTASLQNVGNGCYNFDNIINRVNIDGVMLVNLNDIISAEWLSNFLKNRRLDLTNNEQTPDWYIISDTVGCKRILDPNATSKVSLSHSSLLRKESYDNLRLGGTEPSNTTPELKIEVVAKKLKELSKRNIELILYIDVADQINYAYRTKPKEHVYLQFVINTGHVFAGVTNAFNKYLAPETPLQFSYFACMQKDGFQLQGTGLKSFILSYITSTVKYISKDFAKNIYLSGIKNEFIYKNMSHHRNSDLIGCMANNYKFISLYDIHLIYELNQHDKDMRVTKEFDSYKSEIKCMLQHIHDKKKEIITAIKDVKSNAKNTIEKIVGVNNSASNILIGMNLDPEFDLQIYNGIQSILNKLQYIVTPEKKKTNTPLNPFAPMFNGNNTASAVPTKIEDDETGVTVEFKIVSILDLMASGMDTHAPNSIFGGTGSAQKKSVCVSYIPVNIPGGSASPANINGYIKSIGSKIDIYNNVISNETSSKAVKYIYVVTGINLTHEVFKKLVDCISNKPNTVSGHKRFESKYINFDINPYLRCNMAYYNYMNMANTITLNNVSENATPAQEPFYIRNSRLYARFHKYFTGIRGIVLRKEYFANKNLEKVASQCSEKSESECCKCCKCMSRFGTEYHEYKYIPYLEDKVIAILEKTDDLWIPRV